MIKVEGSDREKPEPRSSGSWIRDRPTLLLIILCALSSLAWPDAAAQTPARTPVPEIKPTQPVKEAVSSLAYDPKGAILAVGRYARIEIHRSPSSHPAQNLSGPAGQVLGVAFSPDGALLAAGGGNPSQFGEVRIWEVETWREVKTFRGHRDQLLALAFSPDGTRIATASYDRLIKLWDVKSGAELQTLKDHTEAVFAIAFSPDGRRLASASSDRTVKIWDVTTGERVLTLSDALDGLNTVAFHPQGKQVAAAGNDRVIRIWELGASEGKQIRSIIAHEDAVNRIVYSPDGRLIASTGADRLLKLWDSTALTEIHTCERQPDWVFALAFRPDGRRLVVGRYDGSIMWYDPLNACRREIPGSTGVTKP